MRKDVLALRQAAIESPGTAHLSEDGRMMLISFDGRDVWVYTGPNFSSMNADEINAYIAKMDRE